MKGIKQPTVKDYDEDNVSSKVLKVILSYIEYVNREVWKKNIN
jgi:UDP-N-acetylglucosamine 2-epimerase (non-hydrolysing)